MMSENTLNYALRRLGYSKEEIVEATPVVEEVKEEVVVEENKAE